MQKRLIIGIAGSDAKEFRDVAILPNTRAIDVLNQLNLRGFQLAKPDGGMFAHADNLYDAVADGQKLYSTKADVETGWLTTGCNDYFYKIWSELLISFSVL